MYSSQNSQTLNGIELLGFIEEILFLSFFKGYYALDSVKACHLLAWLLISTFQLLICSVPFTKSIFATQTKGFQEIFPRLQISRKDF